MSDFYLPVDTAEKQGTPLAECTFDEITQLNNQLGGLHQELSQKLSELGQAYYDIHLDTGGLSELQEKVVVVQMLHAEIDRCQEQIFQSMGIERCQSCHAELIAGADFCVHCGAKVVRRTPQPSCPKCGAAVGMEDLFCITCGADLHSKKVE